MLLRIWLTDVYVMYLILNGSDALESICWMKTVILLIWSFSFFLPALTTSEKYRIKNKINIFFTFLKYIFEENYKIYEI